MPPTSRRSRAGCCPGLVDAHCHVGLGPHGEVPARRRERQALTDRDAGTLLIRDAGQPGDTRWVDDARGPAEDHPRRPPHRPHPPLHPQLRPRDRGGRPRRSTCGSRPTAATAGSSSSATGSTATWATSRRAGRATAVADAIAAAHEEGVRVTAHCFGEESLRDLAAAGIDCIEHATGLQEDSIDTFAAQGIAIVPTLVNIAHFPQLAGRRRGEVPRLPPAHARPARAALRHDRRRLRGRGAGLRRHRRRRQPRRTGSSARRWSS